MCLGSNITSVFIINCRFLPCLQLGYAASENVICCLLFLTLTYFYFFIFSELGLVSELGKSCLCFIAHSLCACLISSLTCNLTNWSFKPNHEFSPFLEAASQLGGHFRVSFSSLFNIRTIWLQLGLLIISKYHF